MGVWVYTSRILVFGINCRRVVSFTPRPLHSRRKGPDIHCIGGWVCTTWKGENSSPYLDSNSDPWAVQPVASRYTDSAIPAPTNSSSSSYYYYYYIRDSCSGGCDDSSLLGYNRVVR
jgi:hypothetical protein